WALYDGQGRPLLADPSKRGEWRSSTPAVSNDGEMVAERSSFFEVQLRSAANATPIGNPFTGRKEWAPLLIAFSPDDRLMAAGGRDNDVMLWNVKSGELVANAIKGHSGGYLHGLHTFAFSPDSHLLASGGRDSKIFLWDTTTGKPVGDPLLGHEGPVEAVAFSHDGRLLAAGGAVPRVTLYDLYTR